MENTLPTNGAHPGVDQLGEKLCRIKTDIQDVVGLTRTLAGEKLHSLSTSAVKGSKAAVTSVTDAIEEYPIRSALIAVGIGAVVGYLLRRR